MAGSVQHPLFDIEVEQALIGAFMVDSRYIAPARAIVAAEDFSDELHQLIIQLCFDFDEEQRPVNPITLNAWIKHNPALKNADKLYGEELPPGREAGVYLAHLAACAPSLPNVPDYAQLVVDFSIRRQAVWALGEAEDAIKARDKATPAPMLEALSPILVLADQITDRQASQDYTPIGDAGYQLLRRIETQATAEEAYACPTGITRLDEIIGGLMPGKFIVGGGRPGQGKSIFATNVTRVAALAGWEVDYWTLEMGDDEIAARLQADIDYESAINEGRKPLGYGDLLQLKATQQELYYAAQANERLRDLPISVFDAHTATMARIGGVFRARVAKAQARGKRKLLIVDHGGLIEPERRRGESRRLDDVAEITRGGKRLAKRTDSPVMFLWQLNRGVEERDDKRPQTRDFRDSGTIEQDADVLLGFYRPLYYAQLAIRSAKNEDQRAKAETDYQNSKGVFEYGVLKNRGGADEKYQECFVDPRSSALRDVVPTRAPVAGLNFQGER